MNLEYSEYQTIEKSIDNEVSTLVIYYISI